MGNEHIYHEQAKKKEREIDRESNTALYLLRCTELGLHMDDLEQLTVGIVLDMLTERKNDDFEYPYKATQADFDRF